VKRLAVVTGASSGIGAALADAFAAEGMDVALVARDTERLEAVAERCRSRHGVAASIFPCDLSDDVARAKLGVMLADLPVTVLANNAGFGVHGDFHETSLTDELRLVRLQVDAALVLCKALVPGMRERREGRVMNVGSVYSFAPVPGQAVYAATKAFLRSFTESLSAELKGTGVTMTGVYPGVTQSEFRRRAGIASKKPNSGATAETVAKGAVTACLAGRLEYIPGGVANRIFVQVMRRLPGRLAAWFMTRINRARGLSAAQAE